MRKMKRTPLLLLLVLLGLFACVVPGVSQVDENAAGTAVRGTLDAIIRETQDAGQPIVDTSTDTPVPTSTAFPTFTPIADTPTSTITPTHTLPPPPTFTLTPSVPMVSVSVATNCRRGPGTAYQILGYLSPGRWVQVYARVSAGDYWYIRNPANSSQFCWIWGEYATVIGLNGSLPVYTPPPTLTPTMTSTPSPDFDASYLGLQSCASTGKFWADLKLKNTGTATFRSVRITLVDALKNAKPTLFSNDFTDRTGCNNVSTKDTLAPGKAVVASSNNFAYNPGGHKINATVTLCTGLDLNGYCVTQKFTFKP